jgi:hypothetical protein
MGDTKKEDEVKPISKKSKRPPLGLIPKAVFMDNRFNDVCGAITRYYKAGLKIPVEWIEEYNGFIDYYQKLTGRA